MVLAIYAVKDFRPSVGLGPTARLRYCLVSETEVRDKGKGDNDNDISENKQWLYNLFAIGST